jgi:hypothetical protein
VARSRPGRELPKIAVLRGSCLTGGRLATLPELTMKGLQTF